MSFMRIKVLDILYRQRSIFFSVYFSLRWLLFNITTILSEKYVQAAHAVSGISREKECYAATVKIMS